MSIEKESTLQLSRVIVELARELPPATREALISTLEIGGECRNLIRFAATPAMKERLRRLEDLITETPSVKGEAIALAILAANEAVSAMLSEHQTDIAWTGSATNAVPLRRVDQVIYDMVEKSTREVILVTYAAYKAELALQALHDATNRGVSVKLIIELANESGGKISFDGLPAFRAAVPAAQIYYWPLEMRKPSADGSYGTMHAKCLVADGSRALVSSANLTDHALRMNMELGLITGRATAIRLAEHFNQLISRGELVLAP